MIRYLTARVASYALMVFVATSLSYVAAVSFLDPRPRLLLRTPRPAPEAVTAQLAANGLDPDAGVLERYARWLAGVVFRFDWGLGPDGTRVNDEFFARALVSGRLVLLATLASIVVGVALGVYAASRQYSWGDRVVTGASYLLSTIPAVVLCLGVQMAGIAVNERAGRRLVHVSGASSPTPPAGAWGGFVDLAQHLVLPTIALTLLGHAGYQLLQRSLLLDTIGADHVRAARARGLTRGQAVRRHAVRTSFIPVAQGIAFAIPAIFTGTFVVEQVFAWQGLGVYTLSAITATQDVNAVVAGVAFGGVTFAVGAILADLSVALVDPRVRVH